MTLDPVKRRVKSLEAELLNITSQLTINGTPVDTDAILIAPDSLADLNGEKLVIDADADTYIRQTGGPSGTDDSVDMYIAGALDFQWIANTFIAKASSKITTDTIDETTAGSGVTIDGVLLKDSQVTTDVINEKTAAAGVTADGVLMKDTAVYGRTPVLAVSADGAITISAYNKAHFVTKEGVAAMTIADPTTNTHDGVELTFIATTANAHTLSNAAGSGFFSSGGSTKDVATFGGAIGDRITIIAYQGKWYIKDTLNITLG